MPAKTNTRPQIKAIDTLYKGYKFRSRLEARWAVFFDAIGLAWDYEPEGYALSDGSWYLPDFLVTSPQGFKTWYEVKAMGARSDSKMDRFEVDMVEESHRLGSEDYWCTGFTTLEGGPWQVFAALLALLPLRGKDFRPIGRKPNGDPEVCICPSCGSIGERNAWHGIGNMFWGVDYHTYHQAAVNCHPCDLGHGGNPWAPYVVHHKGTVHCMDVSDLLDTLSYGCGRAQAARFEHGETPR